MKQLTKIKQSIYQHSMESFSVAVITRLLKLCNNIMRAMKKGEITISVFADYLKALCLKL